ncbi:uncharacterized protein M437DRAFT_89439 [Aureobasidium melanogenum CBS 110374]|uniref:Uncharacterized protein n=1 Tax=Aureobasidium melanogenum (strain CBS 110374) TaxID=1043003 RepID=A0A074VEK3_AURM1|nr:uncharacterized protein M437DRAFT_89439 [Aureobasidium melanogenum CBS 110374]KEQ57454.1 hypothetical protein M437DRAFT_89439 [Aureobasidium melanogenum CBS 110374]
MARENSCGRRAFVRLLVVLHLLASSFLSSNQNLRQLAQHVANYGGFIILSGLDLRTGKS